MPRQDKTKQNKQNRAAVPPRRVHGRKGGRKEGRKDFVNVRIGPTPVYETRVRTLITNHNFGLSALQKASIRADFMSALRASRQNPRNEDKQSELGNILVLTIEHKSLLDLSKLTAAELAHARAAYESAVRSTPYLTLNQDRRYPSWEEILQRQGLEQQVLQPKGGTKRKQPENGLNPNSKPSKRQRTNSVGANR